MIVDPFCGSATTLLAAKKSGRSFVGCEIDSGMARLARRRLAAKEHPEAPVVPPAMVAIRTITASPAEAC